jgi:PAS domain S-box-containing protein
MSAQSESQPRAALTQELLQITASRLDVLIENVPFGILFEDEARRVLYANQAFCDLFGLSSPDALLGMDCAAGAQAVKHLFADSEGFIDLIERLNTLRAPAHGLAFPMADERVLECDYIPVISSQGYVGSMWQYRDITERKRADAELNRLYQLSQEQLAELQTVNERLRELEQLKTDMIRVAAHDIRSPLGIVIGYLDLIRQDMDENLRAQFTPYFDAIDRAMQRMQRMTTDILSLERIQATQDKEWQRVHLRDLVERACLDNREPAMQKRVVYSYPLPDDDIMVLGDSVQLYEAVSNLINNAIKYTPAGGSVTVYLTADRDTTTLRVEDTGYGVPEEMQERLFQPFFRAKTPETRGIDGTGLGLYLVKNIIQRHGGRMHAHSLQGKGSSFGFTLPLYR